MASPSVIFLLQFYVQLMRTCAQNAGLEIFGYVSSRHMRCADILEFNRVLGTLDRAGPGRAGTGRFVDSAIA